MKVNGADHDMLLLSLIFKWYGHDTSSISAHQTARDDNACVDNLTADDIVDLLDCGGLEAMVFSTQDKHTRSCVAGFAAQGAVVLFDARIGNDDQTWTWRLVGDSAPGLLPLLSLAAGHYPDELAGGMGDIGAFGVLIPVKCPAWHGSWRLLMPP